MVWVLVQKRSTVRLREEGRKKEGEGRGRGWLSLLPDACSTYITSGPINSIIADHVTYSQSHALKVVT